MKRFFAAALLSSALFANTLEILNDSPYKLSATIFSASGTNLGGVQINPQNQFRWEDPYDMQGSISNTPYTVVWRCLDGTEYGVASQVAAGATTTAQSTEGAQSCRGVTLPSLPQQESLGPP